MKTDQNNRNCPNGYHSDQGKTQRADQTKLNDVAVAQSSDRKNTEESEGQRETDEGGTSYTRDLNDRPQTESLKGEKRKAGPSSPPTSHNPTSGDARADISPRSI